MKRTAVRWSEGLHSYSLLASTVSVVTPHQTLITYYDGHMLSSKLTEMQWTKHPKSLVAEENLLLQVPSETATLCSILHKYAHQTMASIFIFASQYSIHSTRHWWWYLWRLYDYCSKLYPPAMSHKHAWATTLSGSNMEFAPIRNSNTSRGFALKLESKYKLFVSVCKKFEYSHSPTCATSRAATFRNIVALNAASTVVLSLFCEALFPKINLKKKHCFKGLQTEII